MILRWFEITCRRCGQKRKYTRRRICQLCRSATAVSVAPGSTGSRAGFDGRGFLADVARRIDLD